MPNTISHDDEILNEIHNHIFNNKFISKLNQVINFEKAETVIIQKIIDEQNSQNVEKLLLYVASQGDKGIDRAKSIINKYLLSGDGDIKKLKSFMMLSAKFGDMELYRAVSKAGGEAIWEKKEAIYTNQDGKNILHYACQSENDELVKEIADKIKSEYKVENPFTIKDRKRFSINYIRPQHYISKSLAEKLDRRYNLDGNKNGSFTSMCHYYIKIRKVLNQSFSGYLMAKAKKDHVSAETSIYSGKYIGGLGVVTWNNTIQSYYGGLEGIIATNYFAGIMIGSAAALSSAVIFATNAVIRKFRAKRLDISPDLQLDGNQSNKEVKKANYKNDNQANYNLDIALTYRDFSKVKEIIEDEVKYDKHNLDFISDKLIKRISKTYYFPDSSVKKDFFKLMASKSKPVEFELVINDLIERKDYELVKEVLLDSLKDPSKHERIALLAAKLGDIDILNKAIAKLPDTKMLSIKNEKGDNLLHYACSNGGNVEMIRYLEPVLSQEFRPKKENSKIMNVFDLPNNDGIRPKHLISRETANSLDRLNNIDPEKDPGFSQYLNADSRRKNRDAIGEMVAIGAGGAILTGMLAAAVPGAINVGFKTAATLGATGTGGIALLISTAVETATTVAFLKMTELLINPTLTSAINRFTNYLYEVKDGYNFSIKSFSEKLSSDAVDVSKEMAFKIKSHKPKVTNIKELKDILINSSDISEENKPIFKKLISNIIDESMEKITGKSEQEKIGLFCDALEGFSTRKAIFIPFDSNIREFIEKIEKYKHLVNSQDNKISEVKKSEEVRGAIEKLSRMKSVRSSKISNSRSLSRPVIVH